MASHGFLALLATADILSKRLPLDKAPSYAMVSHGARMPGREDTKNTALSRFASRLRQVDESSAF